MGNDDKAKDDEIIKTAILAAGLLRPYYARAFSALQPVARPGLGTVAVDHHWRLYYDPEWLAALPVRQQAGVIACHEVEHLLRDHASRYRNLGGDVLHKVWNIAGDAEINDDCDPNDMPPNGALPSSLQAPDGLLAEDYIDYVKVTHVKCCGGGSGAGNPLKDELPGDGSSVDQDTAQQIRQEVAADVRSYVAQNGRGSVPAGVQVWAEVMAPKVPKITWGTLFSKAVSRTVREVKAGRDDYRYGGLHRRQQENSPLRPKSIAYLPTVGIVADTSGSMFEDAALAIGTIKSIVSRAGKCVVVQSDAGITSITKGMPKKWFGGGGTDLTSAIDRLSLISDLCVVVTDGDTPWPNTPPKIPVIALLTQRRNPPPSWITAIYINDKQEPGK